MPFGETAVSYNPVVANAVDRTFVQFYPTLLPITRAKGTLTAAYLAREVAEAEAAAH